MSICLLKRFYCPSLFTVICSCPVSVGVVAVMVAGPPTIKNEATPLTEFMLTTLLLLELQVTLCAGVPLTDAVKVAVAPTLKWPLELRPQGLMRRPVGATGMAVACTPL